MCGDDASDVIHVSHDEYGDGVGDCMLKDGMRDRCSSTVR